MSTVRIQVRRGTAAQWTAANPVLEAGEIGFESDTNLFKFGNGDDAWTLLEYAAADYTAFQNTLDDYLAVGLRGTANGVAALDSNKNVIVPGASIIVEGITDNAFETTLTVTDPTADRTITFPDATGTVALTSDISELSQDAVNTALTAGTGITKTYDDALNTITVAVDTTAIQAKVADVSDTEIGYLNGVTSAIQTQIDSKFATANASTTNISEGTNQYFTVERAQDAVGEAVGTGLSYNDTTGAISVDTTAIQAKVANVDDTEIGYLNGVTSGIQTQIDNKASLSGATFTGAVSGTSLTLSGDLTVNGTTTTLNSTTISVDDKNIELGSVATPSDATADGGGITLKGTTDKTFNWVDATDAWTSSEHINLASGKSLYLNGTLLKDATETLTNKTLTSPVINTPTGITKSDVGLANVDNTTDANKPISTATQTALDLKLASATAATTYAPLASPTFTGTVTLPSGTVTSTMIADGTIADADINASAAIAQSKIDGLSTSLSAKADLAGPTFTGTVTLPSTTSIGDVSSTELSYLNNVTSAIQTQLDGKVDESLFDTKGDILVASADNTPAKLAAGTNGYLLTANSAAANGVEWAAAPVSLPTQTDNSGKYLTTDGTTASWGTLVVPITTGTSTVSANTATTIDTTALSAFTSIEYMVSLKQGSKIRTSKVVVQTDGTSVDMTEFAITETGGTIAGVVVSVAVASTNAVLQLTATDAVTTNVTVKFSKVAL